MKLTQNITNLQGLSFMRHASLKVGILGGTFDPAHKGHLMISNLALKYYNFDYVIWLVANQNPFKQTNKRDIFARGCDAQKIVTNPRIIVSSAEHDLKTRYSYDSLNKLTQYFPTVRFSWLMGIDNAMNFRKWYRAQDILELCNVMVFDRLVQKRLVNLQSIGLMGKAMVAKNERKAIIIARDALCDISSTQIRTKLRA